MSEDLMTYEDSRIEQWCEIMHDAYERAAVGAGWETNPASRKPWADVPEANKATMRAAVGAIIEHADAEWRAGHPPFALTFTGSAGLPLLLGDRPPATRMLHPNASQADLESFVDAFGVTELGALAGIARAILVAVECKHYPQRWVEPLPSGAIFRSTYAAAAPLRFEVGVDVDEPVPFVPVVDPPPGEPATYGLDALADEVWEWHLRELGEGTTVGKAAKVAEEAGELIGHTIKSTEPRPDAAEHWQKARLEIADVIIAALGAARGLGVGSVDEVVREKWATVSARRFATAESERVRFPLEDGDTGDALWDGRR